MLTRAEVSAHERKFRRLMLEFVALIVLLVIGLFVSAALVFVAAVGLFIQNFRVTAYMLKDSHLRGSPAYWVLVPMSFFAWLLWRDWHPISTREDSQAAPGPWLEHPD